MNPDCSEQAALAVALIVTLAQIAALALFVGAIGVWAMIGCGA